MDASTTISQMLACSKIYVPTYQRAYSWDTDLKPEKGKVLKQVNQFLKDLEDYVKSSTTSKYYFGHFLFEKKSSDTFGIIDGQQRLTTITIFLSALFRVLKSRRPLTDEEDFVFKSIISIGNIYRFTTVDYDNQLFKDYVIKQTKSDHKGLDTESQKRIVAAFDFFVERLNEKDENSLLKLLNAVKEASCTTHVVENESDAIQMFIFQNNRGKKPSRLEIIKAQFLFNIHLYGGTEAESLIDEIKNRFERIYKSISILEKKVDEDDILSFTTQVYFNSLWETNATEKVNEQISKGSDSIQFIMDFSQQLSRNFDYLKDFFNESDDIHIYSLTKVGSYNITMPFIIKACVSNISKEDMDKLCVALESIIVRNNVIGTRAILTSRLNDVYQQFNDSINDIINRISWMKKQEGWWVYWNDVEFKRALQGYINPYQAKYLLWKYENHLIEKEGKAGYAPMKYDDVKNAQLEHIAPQNPAGNPAENGYCEYDEEFRNQYLDCLGNYLLLSGYHNDSISNGAFEKKRETYNQLRQQIEVQQMTERDKIWDKEKISERKKKIIDFILATF